MEQDSIVVNDIDSMKIQIDTECEKWNNFEDELASLINKYSMENYSNTPDFILAKYLIQCITNFNYASCMREDWFGKHLSIEVTPPTLNKPNAGNKYFELKCEESEYLQMMDDRDRE